MIYANAATGLSIAPGFIAIAFITVVTDFPSSPVTWIGSVYKLLSAVGSDPSVV